MFVILKWSSSSLDLLLNELVSFELLGEEVAELAVALKRDHGEVDKLFVEVDFVVDNHLEDASVSEQLRTSFLH